MNDGWYRLDNAKTNLADKGRKLFDGAVACSMGKLCPILFFSGAPLNVDIRAKTGVCLGKDVKRQTGPKGKFSASVHFAY